MTEPTPKQQRYYALQALAKRCPRIVNGVKVTGTTRLVLWCLAFHCSGDTDSTFVRLDTIEKEVRCSKTQRDKAIGQLKESGLLLETQEHFDPKNERGSAATRTLNRKLLEAEVARGDAEHEPRMAQKRLERQCRKMLKTLDKAPRGTYGPASMSKVKEVMACLNRLSTYPLDYMGQEAKPDQKGPRVIFTFFRKEMVAEVDN
jgi:hypothetical protein